MSGARGTEFGTFVTGDTASSVMSPSSPYTIMMVGLVGAGGKARGGSMSVFSQLKPQPISHGLGYNPSWREDQPGHPG